MTLVRLHPHKYATSAAFAAVMPSLQPCKSSSFSSPPLILALFSPPQLAFSLCAKTNGSTTCWKAAKGSGEVTNGNGHALIYYDNRAWVHKVNWVNREGLCAKLFIHFSNWGIFLSLARLIKLINFTDEQKQQGIFSQNMLLLKNLDLSKEKSFFSRNGLVSLNFQTQGKKKD